jgi:hypothetical protein
MAVQKLKTELRAVEGKIQAIETAVGKDKSLEEGVALLQQQLDDLDKKFPVSEQEALRVISKLAYKYGLDVSSVKPQPKNLLMGTQNKAMAIDGKACQRLPVAIIAGATYKKCGDFFETVQHKIPYLTTVDRLRLTKTSAQYELNADIVLTVYPLTE